MTPEDVLSQSKDDTSIHTRALLVKLSIRAWTARRYDKRVTEQINRQHGASDDAGRYNKMLLPGAAASYKAVCQAATVARTAHYDNTLAWSDEGWRLLPVANYWEYTRLMREAQLAFRRTVDAFVADYPALRHEARARLNGMYAEEDYPGTTEILGKFSMTLDFSPLPAHGDFRIDGLPQDTITALEASVEGRVAAAVTEAMRDAWNRLFAAVAHLHERLSDPEAIFRDSLIGNLRELVDVLPRLNVTDDADLAWVVRRIETDIASWDPQALREDTAVRAVVSEEAEDILTAMQAAGYEN